MKKAITLLLCAFLMSTTVQAQDSLYVNEGVVPRLNGHFFPSVSQMRSSFINTSLQADIGYGTTSKIKIPGLQVGDYELFSFEGQLIFADLNVQYQQKFTPWFAMFATIKMAARMGSDMSTILATGINSADGGEIGTLIRLYHNEKFNLSTSLKASQLNASFIDPSNYIKELLDSVSNPSGTLNVPAMSVGLGLRVAYAFNASYGVQAELNYAYGESLKREITQGYFAGGFVADVDFNPKRGIPLGIAVGYTITSAPEIVMSDAEFASLFSTKFSYTGSESFELGLQYFYYNMRLDSIEDNPFISKLVLSLKFYF